MSAYSAVSAALAEADVACKLDQVAALPDTWPDNAQHQVLDLTVGWPERPRLVDPLSVPRRKLSTTEGRAALIHAVTHIEFNAINLALDACARFASMPAAYYTDWIHVAKDEARHFQMLSGHLASYGYAYGDFDAHGGLWDAAARTSHDVLARMAIVPRVLEARGLDVTPGLIQRMQHVGDGEAARILSVILEDEVAHVAAGNRWYNWLCSKRGLDAEGTFQALCVEHSVPPPRAPVNTVARRAAGYTESEIALCLAEARVT